MQTNIQRTLLHKCLRDGEVYAPIAIVVWCVAFMVDVPPSGDEGFYLHSARLLAEFLTTFPSDSAGGSTLVDQLVGTGWFPPGMSFALLPPSLVVDDVSLVRIGRLSMATVNALVVWHIARSINKRFGAAACLTYSAVVALNPTLLSFCSTFWGEVLSANLVCLAVLKIYDHDTIISQGRFSPVVAGIVIGLLFYLRSNLFLLVYLYLCWVFLVMSSNSKSVRDLCIRFTAHGLCFLLLYGIVVSPWVISNSIKHGLTLTTTTLPLSQIAAFADQDYLADSVRRTKKSNIYYSMYQDFSEKAAAQGTTYMRVARQERDLALRGLTLKGYLAGVSRTMDRFYGDTDTFLKRFFELYERGAGELSTRTKIAILTIAKWSWGVLLIFGLAMTLAVFRPDDAEINLILLIKGLFFIYSTQAFVADAHGRYFVQLVPCLAVAAGLFVSRAIKRERINRAAAAKSRVLTRRLIYASQGVLSIYTTVTILLLAG